jgi:hypothetical protein
MSRVNGNPTASPRALHHVASQHISTLPHTSGRYILGGEGAQVKHPQFAAPIFASTLTSHFDFFRAGGDLFDGVLHARAHGRRTCFFNARWIVHPNDVTIAVMDGAQYQPHFSADSTRAAMVRNVQVSPENQGGIYLGERQGEWVFAGRQRSVLVLGPSRSGKTSSLVTPNLLLSEGPVVSTSTKPDVMEATATTRGRRGWTFLYDPSGDIACPPNVQPVGWSPLSAATEWDAAVQTSTAMVSASGSVAGARSDHHWTERAGALLAPLLHAAALESLNMQTVLRWIDRRDGATPLQILSTTVGEDAGTIGHLVDRLRCSVGLSVRKRPGIDHRPGPRLA